MEIALWVVSGLLAVAFLAAGSMKVARSKPQLAASGMGWVEEVSAGSVKAVGAAEVLGAIGLILPQATGILPWLTPVAAFCLALTMVVASAVHVKRGEQKAVPATAVLGLLSLLAGLGWVFLA